MARGEQPGPGSRLPALYRSPWSGLAEALKAVAADLRLSLRRLWRRNREGELPVPQVWPQGLAPLFWPLLLSAALALLIGLGSRLVNAGGAARATAPEAGDNASGGALKVPMPEERLPGSAASLKGSSPAGDGPAAAGSRPLTPRSGAPERTAETTAADAERLQPPGGKLGAGDGGAGDAATAATTELRLDPLLELLRQGEDGGLLLAARPDPAGSRLSLTLSDAAAALPQAALLEHAQQWQQRAREAGYERLELRDRQGRLRGREALVGSGMILLSPVPAS